MNLSQITTQFTALANRRDLTANAALVQTFIDQGVMRVQRQLRVPAMEKSVNVTITAPYVGLVIPNDLLELIRIVPAASDDITELNKCDLPRALNLAQIIGAPKEYARQAGLWVLGPAPGIGDIIRVDYYAELTPLINPTDTNSITIIAWDLIMYAALVQQAIYYKDARKADFEEQYQTALGLLQDQADDDEENGAAAVMPTYQFPTDLQFENY